MGALVTPADYVLRTLVETYLPDGLADLRDLLARPPANNESRHDESRGDGTARTPGVLRGPSSGERAIGVRLPERFDFHRGDRRTHTR